MNRAINKLSTLSILLCLCLAAICSTACQKSGSQVEAEEISFNDAADNKNKNVVVFEDDLEKGEKLTNTFGEKKPDTFTKGNDDSEISTMYDGYGNKIEKRFFAANAKINNVVVQTTATGEVEVKVYGQSGETVKLAPEMAEQVLTAKGDQIADFAHIYKTREIRQMPTVVNNLPPQTAYSNYPVQNQPPNSENYKPPVQTQTNEEITAPAKVEPNASGEIQNKPAPPPQ